MRRPEHRLLVLVDEQFEVVVLRFPPPRPAPPLLEQLEQSTLSRFPVAGPATRVTNRPFPFLSSTKFIRQCVVEMGARRNGLAPRVARP
jgi:hypothetical protein